MNKSSSYLKTAIFCFVLVIIIVFVAACASAASVPKMPPLPPSLELLKAINKVEASGVKNTAIKGDHGKALGPFQIHYSYWKDATEFDKSIGGKYEDCARYDYAIRIVHAYWRRFAPSALKRMDCEALARIHNGGPLGDRHASTLDYWRKVKKHLTQG